MAGGFREALLKQDGLEPGALPPSERESLERLFARDRAGVRWLKWGTALGWILTVLVYVASAVQMLAVQGEGALLPGAAFVGPQEAQPGYLMSALQTWETPSKLFVLRIIMPVEAAALSLWLYLRTRRPNRKKLQAALAACESECSALSGGKRRPGPTG